MLLAYQNLAYPSPRAPKQAPATMVTLLPLDGYDHSSATSSDYNDLTIAGFATDAQDQQHPAIWGADGQEGWNIFPLMAGQSGNSFGYD